jgi:hypothetical protein
MKMIRSECNYTSPCAVHDNVHEDDSYGGCVICCTYIPHTDGEYEGVSFPCPTVLLARAEERLRECEDENNNSVRLPRGMFG